MHAAGTAQRARHRAAPVHAAPTPHPPARNLTLTSTRHPQHYLPFPFPQLDEQRSCATLSDKASVPWATTRPRTMSTSTSATAHRDSSNDAQTLALPSVLADNEEKEKTLSAPPSSERRTDVTPVRTRSAGKVGGICTLAVPAGRQRTSQWRFFPLQALGKVDGGHGSSKRSPSRSRRPNSSSGRSSAFPADAGRLGSAAMGEPRCPPASPAAVVRDADLLDNSADESAPNWQCDRPIENHHQRSSSRSNRGNRGSEERRHEPAGIGRLTREQQREEWVLATLRAYLHHNGGEEGTREKPVKPEVTKWDEDTAATAPLPALQHAGCPLSDSVPSAPLPRQRPTTSPASTTSRANTETAAQHQQRHRQAASSVPVTPSLVGVARWTSSTAAPGLLQLQHSRCPLSSSREGQSRGEDTVGRRLREALALPTSDSARQQQRDPVPARVRGGSERTCEETQQRAPTTTADRFAARMEAVLHELADAFAYERGSRDRDRLLSLAVAVREHQVRQDFVRRHPLAAARPSPLDPAAHHHHYGNSSSSVKGRGQRHAFGPPRHPTASAKATTTTTATITSAKESSKRETHNNSLLSADGRSRTGTRTPATGASPSAVVAAAAAAADRYPSDEERGARMAALLHEHDDAVAQVEMLEAAAERSLQCILDKYEDG